MKRQKRWPGLICKAKQDEGSIALEAALVTPLFLFMLVVVITFIHISAVQMALQDAVSQTVRQTASYIYPASLAVQSFGDKQEQQTPSKPAQNAGISAAAAQLSQWLPEPAGSLMTSALNGNWGSVQDWVVPYAFEPVLRQFAEESLLESDNVTISKVSLPDLKSGANPYLSMTAEYKMPIRLPFINKPLVLQEHAAERVWIPDSLPSNSGQLGQPDSGSIQIVSLEPTPVLPGRKARITVLTEPGRRLKLSVHYKSGRSKARNLGEAVADENGVISWEWHVSGNTTPGTWEFVIQGEDGASARLHFEVRKAK
ncbi:TadE/TadG family type IV pilus assembly protein [Paenibacillus sp. GCM10012307]|uniref:Pilus assembly protein n=1 Tax=Paenibacillus roseus TaxID=2798579 RepID=A0A934J4C2_9BACL|nr:TadE/TadG family type IV pilus assembly protein [Paenibacillus roseus]MBJ6361429.1 pilus assembly protein [Paenibacillus roseus]